VHEVLPRLQRLAPRYVVSSSNATAAARRAPYASFPWFKNDAFSNLSAIGLYQTLAAGGEAAFDHAIAKLTER